jgi:glyoxylate reductase
VPERVHAALVETFSLANRPEGAEGILSLLTTMVDAAYLDHVGAQLRIVANYGVGVDNVDLHAARARNVVVANTPDVLTHPVAELAIAVTLALIRRVAEGDRFIRRHERWSFSLEFMLGDSLRGKTFGVVGPGRIGRTAASLAESLGATPMFAGRGDALDELLRAADVVSLHCPLNAETYHLIDEAALAKMRPGAVLVNTARGPVVDERALVRALRERVIAGAALDVFEFEPEVTDDLLSLENVVLTPHIGSATRDTREAMGMLAVGALRAVLVDGELPPNVVPWRSGAGVGADFAGE